MDLTEEERDILRSNVPDYYRSLVLIKIGISEVISDPSHDRPKGILLSLPLTRLNSTRIYVNHADRIENFFKSLYYREFHWILSEPPHNLPRYPMSEWTQAVSKNEIHQLTLMLIGPNNQQLGQNIHPPHYYRQQCNLTANHQHGPSNWTNSVIERGQSERLGKI